MSLKVTSWLAANGHKLVVPGLVAFLITLCLFAGPRIVPQLLSAEHAVSDWRLSLLASAPKQQRDDILLVTVVDETLREFPYRSPVDRGFLADVIANLDESGARLIVLDFFFDGPTEAGKDAQLLEILSLAKTPIVMGASDQRSDLLEWQQEFQSEFLATTGRAAGFLNIGYDSDGVVRFVPAAAENSPWPLSLADVAFQALGGAPTTGSRRIDFVSKPADGTALFAQVPAHLFAGPRTVPEVITSRLVKDKIVFLGVSLKSTDQHPIPFSVMNEFSDGIAGIEIQAQALAQQLDGRSLRDMAAWLEILILALYSAAGVFVALSPRFSQWKSMAAVVGGTSVLVFDVGCYLGMRLIFPGETAFLAIEGAIILMSFIVSLKSGEGVQAWAG